MGTNLITYFYLNPISLSLSRFAYIFWLKNPAAFHDDFWCFFLSIWINAFGLVCQGPILLNFYVIADITG